MTDATLQLNIISAEKSLFSGEVVSIVLPGTLGKFGVFPNHTAFISSLQKGEIVYTLPGGKTESIEVKGGIVEVIRNTATVCVM